MGLRPTRAEVKIQSLPLTRGRLGGGCLLFSQRRVGRGCSLGRAKNPGPPGLLC